MSKLFNNTTNLNNLLEAIQNKAAGGSGTNTNDATATASDLLEGKTAYVKGQKITGTIITRTQATPSITINSSGLITASATQTAGYVAAGTKSATKQLTTKAATTYTPTTSNQTIAASTYLTGVQTIKGDSNLVASNIKSGISIFGVTGTYTGSSSEDLTSEVNTYTAKITELETAITTLENELQGKASGGGGSLETCTISLVIDGPTMGDTLVYYTNENQELATETFRSSITIKCLKNSIISTNDGGTGVNTFGSLEVLYRRGECLVLHVFGDGNVVIGL